MPPGKYEWKPLTLTPINFSLTEGTSIPAPPDSPPDTPRPPTPGRGPLSSHPTPKSPGFPPHKVSPQSKESHDSAADHHLQQSRTSDAASGAMSPTSPTARRPASVRKFLGLRTLSSSDSLKSERPGSPATINSQAPSLTRRKSGSWFGKKKSFNVGSVPEGKESSTPYAGDRTVSQPRAQSEQPSKPKGPPPPALPELKSFGVNDDTLSLGADDMFKNIK